MSQSDTPRTKKAWKLAKAFNENLPVVPYELSETLESDLTATQRRLRFLVESGAVVVQRHTLIEWRIKTFDGDGNVFGAYFPTPEAAIDDAMGRVGKE